MPPELHPGMREIKAAVRAGIDWRTVRLCIRDERAIADCHIAEELVRRRVFELSRSDRDALMNWPARVAPLIAGEFGIDQVRLAVCLEAHVRQYLSERAEHATVDLRSGRSR
jgi:hypothetical protein